VLYFRQLYGIGIGKRTLNFLLPLKLTRVDSLIVYLYNLYDAEYQAKFKEQAGFDCLQGFKDLFITLDYEAINKGELILSDKVLYNNFYKIKKID